MKNNKLIAVLLIFCALALVSGCLFTSVAKKKQVERQKKQGTLELIRTVYFATNSSGIMPEAAKALDEDVKWMEENDDAVLILEGHCDQRGGEEFNKELGDKRARSVKAYLLSKGVEEKRIAAIISFGKTRPIDPANNPLAWKKNRRVELVPR